MRRAVLVLALILATLGAAPPPTPVIVDGRALASSALATVKDKEYVSLRALGDAIGAHVAYDGKRKQATMTTEFREAVLVIGRSIAIVNGEKRAIDAPPLVIAGRVMMPLRAVALAMGATIGYEQRTHSIVVSTRGVESLPGGAPARSSLPTANTIEGTVTDVEADGVPPAVAVEVDNLSYTITVPEGTKIQFRDTHGGSTGSAPLSAVRPGDTLIATLDAGGHLIAIADIFTGFGGKIASVSSQNMVLTNGRVVESDAAQTNVMLDGRAATFADLKAGDLVTVRADPRTGKVRDVVALTPGGSGAAATATPGTTTAGASGSGGGLLISDVTDDATHAFRAGQTLHVAMDGSAGATATFDLSNVIVANRMVETKPGHYEGSYVVEVGTNLVDAPIIVRLAKDGLTAQAEGPDPLAIITTPPSIEDVKPEAGSQVNNPRPNIYATFSTFGDRGMDAQTLKIIVDGNDVSAQATRTAAFISYLPASTLGGGTVTVEVKGADTAGNPLDFKWSFTVVR